MITPGKGLLSPDVLCGVRELDEIACVEVDARNAEHVRPLTEGARSLAQSIPAECRAVLLGSVATSKYTAPLLDVFGERLVYPAEFRGRGDMSRGGLLLRAAAAGQELAYEPVPAVPTPSRRPQSRLPAAAQ